MHGWLNADEKNVAIVHCQTGNGRTVTLIAAYLSWAGLFQSPDEALQHIAKVRGTVVGSLIIPTQLRYSKYFDSLLHQYKPSIEPIKIERLIMSGIPRFDVNGSVRPYLQIFKNAKLVYTSSKKGEELKWYRPEDHSILFPVGQVLEGDILIRIRHHNSDNNRVSMLRFGFHTGFIEPGNVRFTKEELDGACTSKLFDDDFFLDVIFTKAVDEAGEPIPGSVQPEFWERVTKTKKATASDLNPGFKFTLGDMEEGPEDEVEAKEGKADGAVDHSFQDLANYVKGLEEAEALEEANKSQGVGDIEADLMNELNDMKGNSVAEMEKHLEDFDDADLEHMLGGLDEEEDIEQGLLDALADLDEDDEEDELP
jgi:hypothetical protein